MRVKVLFFGMLRDIVGHAEDSLEMADGSRLAAVFERYAKQYDRLRDLSASIVLARNQEFARLETVLADGDEVAFLPPVSGGCGFPGEVADAGGSFFALTRQAIESSKVARRLVRGEDGAVVTFEGVVRNNSKGRATDYLEYECYEPMALKKMAEIGRELSKAFAVDRIAMVHRLGRLQVGEASVVIVVTAPHRRPAFEAALEAINRLKRTVPIWKKEHFSDGEVWAEGEWDVSAPAVAPR